MRIGIKDGKIYDICSDISHKRDDTIKDEDYLDLPKGDWRIDDTWNSKKNISLKDALRRVEPIEENLAGLLQKTEEQLKIEELEARILELENINEVA